MTKLEDRLRRDLPDLADAMIALHDEHVSESPAGSKPVTSPVTVLSDPHDQRPDRRWMPLLVAASVVLGLIGLGVAMNAIGRSGDGGETAPVIAAQLEDEGVDPGAEALQDQEHRAALVADPPGTLDEARIRWAAEGIDDYRYRLRVLKGDRTIELDIEVSDSVARRLEPLPMPAYVEAPAIDPQWIASVDELFGFVEEAVPPLVPTFDPELGYPTAFRIDPDDAGVGGGLTFRVDELSSIADIESADRALSAWLPEPSMLPAELLPPEEAPSSASFNAQTELYPLHDAGDFVVSLRRQQRDVCLVVTRKDPSSGNFTGLSQTGCISVIKLRDEGVSTRTIQSINLNEPLIFWAILPASHHGQGWLPEVTTDRDYELMSTDQSLLIIFGDDGLPGRVRIDIGCECGDLVYEPRIN